MDVKIFICDYDFHSHDDTILSLKVNDKIEVLFANGDDWWYGKVMETNQEGWFPPTYGHLIITSKNTPLTHQLQYSLLMKLSIDDLIQQREQLYHEYLQQERNFLQQLNLFIHHVIIPIEYQDNNFKRILLSESSIALSFSLYTKIWNSCQIFYKKLQDLSSSSSSPLPPHQTTATTTTSPTSPTNLQKKDNQMNSLILTKISSLFLEFAPSLRLFSQYITENSSVLNIIKSHGKSLNQFLEEIHIPIDTSIEDFLILPVEHYSHYLYFLNKLLEISSAIVVERQKEEIDGLSSLRVNCSSIGPNFLSLEQNNDYDNLILLEKKVEEKNLNDLREAVEILQNYTNEVNEKLMNESRKLILLAVETQFINNPKLFHPDREYITEGELELVKLNSNSTPKLYHAHLFNDALILSTRVTGFTGKFKFIRAIDLCVVTIKQVPSVQLTNSFCLESIYSSDSPSTSSTSTSSPSSYIFHCRSRSGLEWWMKNITEQLTKLSQRNEELLQQKEQRRNSMIKVARRASANWKLNTLPDNLSTESLEQTTSTPPPPPPPSSMSPSPSTTRPSEKLDHIRLSIKDASIRLESLNNPNISQPRVQYILKYLSNEFQFQRNLVDFYQVVIEPLVNTSKGAELIIGLTEIEKIDSFTTRNDLNPILFEKKGSYLGVLDSFTGKKQTQQIIEIISDSNFQIFLYTIENITYTLMEFLLLFEMSLINVNYIDHLIILGTPCTSSQANILYQLFLSYSSSYHTALRILSSSYLGKFIQQTNEKLQSYFTHTSTHTTSTSGTSNTTTIHTFLINILHFPERLKVFLIKLHEMTSINHPDHQLLDHAIQQLRHLIQQMHDVYIGHINYEKLILIQNSFLLNLLQPEPYLKQLVSYQRIFIREGNLIKVCRKANYEYRFWLFNDALLYGKFSHTTRKYKLHRVIELKSICNIQPYNMRNGLERQYSFIINSLEKSFILIATTQDERNSWLYDITTWWNKLNHHHNNTSTTSSGISNTSSNNGANTSTSTGAATTTTPSTSVDGDNEPAPLWVPDSLTSVCYICNITINGVTVRRHHCRKCGRMVCSTHSSKRILLPNIHKTQPQRVCDVCSVLIEERNSLRLSDSFKSKLSESSKSEINNNTPVTNTTTATSGSSDVMIEEKQENSQNSFISTRRFSLKSLKDLKTSTQTTPEPSPPDNNSEEIMKRSKILSKLLSETVTDPSTSSTTASPTTSNTTSSTQTATKHKIIPAFSVPITFMLTHDSVKARKSILLTNDETSMTRDIELSSLPSDPPRSVSHEFSSIDERPSLIPSYRSPIQSSHSILSQSDTGLLNMLTTILKDDRELLMESDDDENADSSSDDDGEDDDEENEEVERSTTRNNEERSLNYPNLE